MTSDLRTFVVSDLRSHPRVAYQGVISIERVAGSLGDALPPLSPFRDEYVGALAIIDWDHRLPSQSLALRIYAYYSEESFHAGEEAYDDRLEVIGSRDIYPEFDVPDFANLAADEAYEVEMTPTGELGRCRLTSAWRRSIEPRIGAAAVKIASVSDEFRQLVASTPDRPARLGDLEAVSWTPPCESDHPRWTLDLWYLLAFDGRIGTGRSFLVDLEDEAVVGVRDFSVRTG